MPASLLAAIVLLVLIVPGYLFQGGVREYTAITAADRDVYAVGQAAAISAGMLLVIYLVVSIPGLEGVKKDLFHNPFPKGEKVPGPTFDQAVLVAVLLTFSNAAGKVAGRFLSPAGGQDKPEGMPEQTGPGKKARAVWHALKPVRSVVWCLLKPVRCLVLWLLVKPVRWVFGLFFRPSPLDRHIDYVIKAACESGAAPTYVRLVRQGQEDVFGLLDADAVEASQLARGSGLALSARWMHDPEQGWRPLGGAHIGKQGLIKILWWNQQQGVKPPWLEAIGSHGGHSPRPNTYL